MLEADIWGDFLTMIVLSTLGAVGVFLMEAVDFTDRNDAVDLVFTTDGLSLVGSIGGTGGGAWR